MLTYVLLRVLHIGSAAAWLGLPLGLPGRVKRAETQGDDVFRQSVLEGARTTTLAAVFGLATLATGLILIFDNPAGFAGVHRNIHTALAIVLVMVVLGFAMLRPAARRLVAIADQPAGGGRHAETRRALTTMNIGGGVTQLLWIVALVLMYWR